MWISPWDQEPADNEPSCFLPWASPDQLKETRDLQSDMASEETGHPWLPGASIYKVPESDLEFPSREDFCPKATEEKDITCHTQVVLKAYYNHTSQVSAFLILTSFPSFSSNSGETKGCIVNWRAGGKRFYTVWETEVLILHPTRFFQLWKHFRLTEKLQK